MTLNLEQLSALVRLLRWHHVLYQLKHVARVLREDVRIQDVNGWYRVVHSVVFEKDVLVYGARAK